MGQGLARPRRVVSGRLVSGKGSKAMVQKSPKATRREIQRDHSISTELVRRQNAPLLPQTQNRRRAKIRGWPLLSATSEQ